MNGIETTTWFDQKPSHPARPDWLTQAEEVSRNADKALDEIVERRCEFASTDEYYDALQVATFQADNAYLWMIECRYAFQVGIIPASLNLAGAAKIAQEA